MLKLFKTVLGLSLIISFGSCDKEEVPGSFEVYCEMVAKGAKPIALSDPIENLDSMTLKAFREVAEGFGVNLYQEKDFPVTALFDKAETSGKEVIVIGQREGLKQYFQLKEDLEKDSSYASEIFFARRFGRLLGYTPQGVNNLLAKNIGYSNPAMSGIAAQITHFYYDDMIKARAFYKKTIGLSEVSQDLFQLGSDTYLKLEKTNDTIHRQKSKSTAIALLTNNLPGWYSHVKKQNVEIKYSYQPKKGGPHDGFVAIDPEGYLLEFEMFKQHPENEPLMASLAGLPHVKAADSLHLYASITWTYHKDILRMQDFYENTLGYRLVADQGWTNIYQTSPTGFIGLVDECRGMENYTYSKPMVIEWEVESWDFLNYWYTTEYEYRIKQNILSGPDNYKYLFSESRKVD